jgi:hypothetical protein
MSHPTRGAQSLSRLAGCDPEPAAPNAGPERLARILVARWLTAAEANLDDHTTWRTWRTNRSAALAYLDLLLASGYTLSDTEHRLHTDLSVLRGQRPALGERLERVRRALDSEVDRVAHPS